MADDVKDGLSVQKGPGNKGWAVVHVESGLRAINPLHYKKDALTAREELLATGCDFTVGKRELWQQPESKDIGGIYKRWEALRVDGSLPVGPRMTFMAMRNKDGLIHITNTLMGRIGQHHVHDEASFADWKSGGSLGPVDESAIEWLPGHLKDCGCGQGIWQRA